MPSSPVVRAILPFLAVLAACGGSPTVPSDPGGGESVEGLSASTPQAVYTRREPIPVVFHNGSDSVVTVGALGCTAWLERREGDHWVPLVSTRLCIQLAVLVGAGQDYPFTAEPADQSGSYRLSFEAMLGGEQKTVRTGVFTVR